VSQELRNKRTVCLFISLCAASPTFLEYHAAMSSYAPWLAMVRTKTSTTFKEYRQAWHQVSNVSAFVVLIGRRTKSGMLQQFLRGTDDGVLSQPHGQVLFWPDPSENDIVYVDCELHSSECTTVPSGAVSCYTADWHGSTDGPFTRRRIGNLFASRAIGPLCNVVCYFASDMGGIRAVASLLASQLLDVAPTDLPYECLPRILVVVETSSQRFDEHVCENSVLEMISDVFRARGEKTTDPDVKNRIRSHFNQVRVIGVKTPNNARERSQIVRRRLMCMTRECTAQRREHGMQFCRDHVRAFGGKMLEHFCSGYKRQFSFVASSRPLNFSTNDFRSHLEELFSLLPSEAWVWHLVCPLLASAIVLACYPPGSHRTLYCSTRNLLASMKR